MNKDHLDFENFTELRGLCWDTGMLNRMNQRALRVFPDEFDLTSNKKILDLGARDARWSWAALQLGASEVVGIESRYDSYENDNFTSYKPPNFKMLIGDAFSEIEKLVSSGERFDTVMCLGFYYHIYDHYGLLRRLRQLEAKYVIIDSEFDNIVEPQVRIRKEDITHPNNASEEEYFRTHSVVGNLSVGGMNLIADILGYETNWQDWDNLNEKIGCDDYVEKTRATCILKLKQ
jgi:hypothetical protein